MNLEIIRQISTKTNTKILFLVIDGLGGLRHPDVGMSELEAAKIPNLDRLARTGTTGLTIPVAPGITPGSGPGHLALFGYDPIQFQIGRGILEAIGLGMRIPPGGIAGRGNFCSLDDNGKIIDRRAGRLKTEENQKLIKDLSSINLKKGSVQLQSGKEHRFALVFEPEPGSTFSENITDSDPQKTDILPNSVTPLTKDAAETADIVRDFLTKAQRILKNSESANGLLIRGFSDKPDLPSISDLYKLNSACIAAYPMYRGLAELLGMHIEQTGEDMESEIQTLKDIWDKHDFFFIHYKPTDGKGEDGDFPGKVKALEELDKLIPLLLDLDPDVMVIAGDHSTPSVLSGHSWHPVPFIIKSDISQSGDTEKFTEQESRKGALGTIKATDLMSIALAHAGKLNKFGA